VLVRRSTQLVQLELGEKFEQHYTFSVVAKVDGLRNTDVYNLVKGNEYHVTLRKRYWRWMFEDEMDMRMSHEERERRLFEGDGRG